MIPVLLQTRDCRRAAASGAVSAGCRPSGLVSGGARRSGASRCSSPSDRVSTTPDVSGPPLVSSLLAACPGTPPTGRTPGSYLTRLVSLTPPSVWWVLRCGRRTSAPRCEARDTPGDGHPSGRSRVDPQARKHALAFLAGPRLAARARLPTAATVSVVQRLCSHLAQGLCETSIPHLPQG